MPDNDKHKPMIKCIKLTQLASSVRPAGQHPVTAIGFTNKADPFSADAFVKSPIPAPNDSVATVPSAASANERRVDQIFERKNLIPFLLGQQFHFLDHDLMN
jgi:hypothetical protein